MYPQPWPLIHHSYRIVGLEYGANLLDHSLFLKNFETAFSNLLAGKPIFAQPADTELLESVPPPRIILMDVSIIMSVKSEYWSHEPIAI